MADDEESVDANKFLYLFVLGIVMEEIAAMFPTVKLEPGTRPRELAERIATRLLLEADLLDSV